MFLEHSANQKRRRLSQLKGPEEKASLRLVLREWSRSDRRPAGKEIALQVSRTRSSSDNSLDLSRKWELETGPEKQMQANQIQTKLENLDIIQGFGGRFPEPVHLWDIYSKDEESSQFNQPVTVQRAEGRASQEGVHACLVLGRGLFATVSGSQRDGESWDTKILNLIGIRADVWSWS